MATINICDICGTRNNVNRRQYPYDRRIDGAGSMDTEYEIYDLCQTHELIVLKLAIKASLKLDIRSGNVCAEYFFNQLIITEIKKMISKQKGMKQFDIAL